MSLYDLLVFGCVDPNERAAFVSVLEDLLDESGVPRADVSIITDVTAYSAYSPRRPTVCACFSDATSAELSVVRSLRNVRAPVIPIARATERFEDFPQELQELNGAKLTDERADWPVTAAAVMESVGLLRAQRRLFISYRRDEARDAALQLHDHLSGSGFQVFLDTHAIRPGKVFQEQLWQSLCDSDVMLMLDTHTYFQRKWTREEFGRAQSMGVNIFRLVFPSHKPNPATQFTASQTLEDDDFDGDRLHANVVDGLAARIERLRARSIAARLTAITGKLKSEVEATGGRINGAGAYRSVCLTLKDGSHVWAYPVVGVPTAPLLHDVARKAAAARQKGPYLVYDHTGLTKDWLDHLSWLDDTIAEVGFMRVSEATRVLACRATP